MSGDASALRLGCTTCRLEVVLAATDEEEVRRALAAFFEAHASCDVVIDLSHSTAPLPTRPADP